MSSFWANRRASVAAEAEAEKVALDAQVIAEEQAAFEDMDEAEVLAALNLPDPDTLKQGDDFSAFMAKAVPDVIRRRALRTLWRSNPVLANVDMLVDYGEDFTDAAMVVENMQTAYQVGKGMLKHVEEMARQAEQLDELEEIEEPQEEEVLIAAVSEEIPAEEPREAEVEIEEAEVITPNPRRMKFRVEETA